EKNWLTRCKQATTGQNRPNSPVMTASSCCLGGRIRVRFAPGWQLNLKVGPRTSRGSAGILGDCPNERPPFRGHFGEHGSGSDPCGADWRLRHCARRGRADGGSAGATACRGHAKSSCSGGGRGGSCEA